ncbi:hypothetical protein ACVWWG_007991 [Bradyrhizobium sp. LB7.2]
MTFVVQGPLPWFGWSNNKAERKIFDEKGYCAVYVAGDDRSLRLGWTSTDPRKVREPVRVIAWCAGELVAKRLVNAASQLLASRRVNSRFDVPIHLAEGAICVAAKNARAEIKSHEAMMEEVMSVRQQRIENVVRESEIASRNAVLARAASDPSPEEPPHLFEPRR